jgi:hypothetical protein
MKIFNAAIAVSMITAIAAVAIEGWGSAIVMGLSIAILGVTLFLGYRSTTNHADVGYDHRNDWGLRCIGNIARLVLLAFILYMILWGMQVYLLPGG